MAAVTQLIESKLPTLNEQEVSRVMSIVKSKVQYVCNHLQAGGCDASFIQYAAGVDHRVKAYHQIYGLFGDGEPMPELSVNHRKGGGKSQPKTMLFISSGAHPN